MAALLALKGVHYRIQRCFLAKTQRRAFRQIQLDLIKKKNILMTFLSVFEIQ